MSRRACRSRSPRRLSAKEAKLPVPASCFRAIKWHWKIPLLSPIACTPTQTNAHLIVSVRGANYIAAIKDNQPTLHQLAQKQLADTSPLFRQTSVKAGFL